MLHQFTFIDLFSGIGGFREGFETIGGNCVFSSEWDKFCIKTYTANHNCKEHLVHWDDIRLIEPKTIPKHDVLLAGFPCQPFSLAGVSKKNSLGQEHGFRCQTQGTLFFDVARILEYHEPKAFLLENVKNLLSHDNGRTFDIIQNTLENELGYKIHYRVIDAAGFVPQHRERIFIAGFRDANDFSYDSLELPTNGSGLRLGTVLHPQNGTEEPEPPFTETTLATVSSKYTLSDHLWSYLQDYAVKHRKRGNGFGYGLVGKSDIARTLSARYYKDGSEILVSQGKNRTPRMLTPRECSRLMGFDSPRESKFIIPVSDAQAYRQFGNAVVVPVVKAIAQHMHPWITRQTVTIPNHKDGSLCV